MNTVLMITTQAAASDWEPPITGQVVTCAMPLLAANSAGDWEPPITG